MNVITKMYALLLLVKNYGIIAKNKVQRILKTILEKKITISYKNLNVLNVEES